MINKRFEVFNNILIGSISKVDYYFYRLLFKIYLNHLICLKFNEIGNENIQKL